MATSQQNIWGASHFYEKANSEGTFAPFYSLDQVFKKLIFLFCGLPLGSPCPLIRCKTTKGQCFLSLSIKNEIQPLYRWRTVHSLNCFEHWTVNKLL